MSAFIDISTPLRPGMVSWPGSPNVEAPTFLRMADGDPANATRLAFDVHCGTHVDAPLHQIDGAAPMASMALDDLCGPAAVVDIGGRASASVPSSSPQPCPTGRRASC